MTASQKFLEEWDNLHLLPNSIELTDVPSITESREAIYDNLASYFYISCARISPQMAERFRQEQEEQEAKLSEYVTALAHAMSKNRQEHVKKEKTTLNEQKSRY